MTSRLSWASVGFALLACTPAPKPDSGAAADTAALTEQPAAGTPAAPGGDKVQEAMSAALSPPSAGQQHRSLRDRSDA